MDSDPSHDGAATASTDTDLRLRGNNVVSKESVIPAERVPAKAGSRNRKMGVHECRRRSTRTARKFAATGNAARSAFPDAKKAVEVVRR